MAGIRDVANKARISPGAVSRYLNQDPTLSISEESKQRIDAAVKELNYSKNNHKSGRKKRSASIGIITAVSPQMEMDDPYFRNIRVGIGKEAKRLKIAANRSFSLYEGISEKDYSSLTSLGALIIIGNISDDALTKVNELNSNIVVVDNGSALKGDCVQVDFEAGVRASLDYLHGKGHRRIAFVGGRRYEYGLNQLRRSTESEARYDAYVNWMREKNLAQYIQARLSDWTPIDGKEMVEDILQEDLLPTAVVAASDPMAVGVYRGIQKAGLQIPEDISVVSFDDIEIAQFLTPELSTSAIDANYLGILAVKLAEERIRTGRKLSTKILIPTDFIARESVSDLTKKSS